MMEKYKMITLAILIACLAGCGPQAQGNAGTIPNGSNEAVEPAEEVAAEEPVRMRKPEPVRQWKLKTVRMMGLQTVMLWKQKISRIRKIYLCVVP